MAIKLLALATALLASTSAMAQAGPIAEKSSEQIVCELTGDCAAVDASLATADKPENRGFSIARRGKPAQTAPTPVVSAPAARVATTATRSHSVVMPARYRAPVAAAPSGRTNLSINFVSGSAVLTDSGRSQALRFMQALAQPSLNGKRFMIGGHTDAVGNKDYNINLSRQRAQSLVDFLAQNGADRSRFDVQGYGFSRPLPGTSPRSANNRRVEIVKLD